ncbi:MAG TPA: NAD(P)-binding domain-containing protein [Steroidobacteraceae bacterium]|jgi:thioredoxin reductase|nr:NAD(P)-binding domain-containing protein [Steroidobacteraceae bacterium]
MNSRVDVAIIGAGPYGLSIAAHLREAGVEHRVFGVPMESWSTQMPFGMCLKSDAQASNLSDPDSSLTLERFAQANRIAYHPWRIPVRLSDFIAYGLAFQQKFVPQVERARLLSLRPDGRGAVLEFDCGDVVTARKVVLATGVAAFKHVPTDLAALPAALVSHSAGYGSLAGLAGKEVAVVGGGSSAIDLAALLAEEGARVTLLVRASKLEFQPTPLDGPEPLLRRATRRFLSPPSHGLGDGWLMRICSGYPGLFHLLPDSIRLAIVSNTLGPSGGYFVRDRVQRQVRVKLDSRILAAEEEGGRIRLSLSGSNGTRETLLADRLIAATGYKVDLRKLDFLGPDVLANLRMVDHTPVLSARFEGSVPGLHFAGLMAARSFGPALRFVMGARHPARKLARELPKSLARRAVSVPIPIES